MHMWEDGHRSIDDCMKYFNRPNLSEDDDGRMCESSLQTLKLPRRSSLHVEIYPALLSKVVDAP